jgi:TM2 domain-containing membrane protein YozV
MKTIKQKKSTKSQTLTILLSLLFGYAGLHLFYIGRYGRGILYLLTFGLLGYGWLFDFIGAIRGSMNDGKGLPITNKNIHYEID